MKIVDSWKKCNIKSSIFSFQTSVLEYTLLGLQLSNLFILPFIHQLALTVSSPGLLLTFHIKTSSVVMRYVCAATRQRSTIQMEPRKLSFLIRQLSICSPMVQRRAYSKMAPLCALTKMGSAFWSFLMDSVRFTRSTTRWALCHHHAQLSGFFFFIKPASLIFKKIYIYMSSSGLSITSSLRR